MGTFARPAEPDAKRRVELERVAEEQAALRRVATLVAGGASPDEVFAAVGDEVARTLGFPTAGMLRFEADQSVTMLATAGLEVLPMRTRLPPVAQVLSTAVLDAGGPARVDYTQASGRTAESVRAQGVHWGVGAPIIVERALWGVMCVGSTEPEPPPSETEARLVKFTELLATAIANAESRKALAQLAEEQAALRSVATLVAEGAQPNRVFAAVADEVAAMFGVPIASMLRFDSDSCATVLATLGAGFALVGTRFPIIDTGLARKVSETGRSASIDDWTNVPGPGAELCRQEGVRWGIGVPIVVDGTLWGMMLAASRDAMPSGADMEPRLAKFTELVATAIANSQARDQLAQLAEEQAALRRVATLVAAGAPPQEVFEAVSVEVAALIPAEGSALTRYEADGTVTALSGWTTEGGYNYVGERYELEGTVSGLIFETGRPGRVENYGEAPGLAPEAARAMGWHSSVGAPITVGGRLWGVLAVISKNESPLPPDTEQRLAAFTELVATAIANTDAHQELARLAVEQAALRRVATLVAAGAPPAEVFDAVTGEVAALIPADGSALTRFEAEGTFTPLSGWAIEGGQKHVGRCFERAGTVSGLIFETGRPGRLEKYAEALGEASAVARELGWCSAVGAPITVAGRLWGALLVVSKSEQPLPPETEGRLVEFTELVATAIANSQAHQELAQLANEQAALRRVATLAAQGATPGEVFEAVSAEVAPLVGGDAAAITRYEADGTFMVVGGWVSSGDFPVTGMHFPLEGSVSGLILETRCPSRIDSFEGQSGEIAAVMLDQGWRFAIGAPISVEGHLWGVLVVYSKKAEPLPADTERRLGQFTQIVATAIANTESRAELEASRARIVATADATRRQIERDLHDGAQQRLVSLALQLRTAQSAAPRGAAELMRQLDRVATGLAEAMEELGEIARGLHPAILAESGLRPALEALARRSAVPVELDVRVEGRLPQPVEIAAYYAVAEALTNVAKHARASAAEVQVEIGQGVLHVSVRDDGHGGACFGGGSGLVGLKDRVEALGGRIGLDNPPGAGTALDIVLPLGDPSGPRRQPGIADPAWEG